MALMKQSSKPITKRKPRRVYKLTSTLGDYKVKRSQDFGTHEAQLNINADGESSLNQGPYKMNDDN